MDWKLLASTYTAIFLAELGDKTQLATLGLSAKPGSKLAVFIGSASALVATSLIAVLAGGAIALAFLPFSRPGVPVIAAGAVCLVGLWKR